MVNGLTVITSFKIDGSDNNTVLISGRLPLKEASSNCCLQRSISSCETRDFTQTTDRKFFTEKRLFLLFSATPKEEALKM
jgi:hypothetical protein